MLCSQAGVTPLERCSEVAPKRGRPPKKLPVPGVPQALTAVENTTDSVSGAASKRQTLNTVAMASSTTENHIQADENSEEERVALQQSAAANDAVERNAVDE